MKIGIACDHRGLKRKKEIYDYLTKKNNEVIDYGPYNTESVDYPDYAFKLCKKLNENEIEFGILLCSTGIGISIAANKVKNIRCAKLDSINDAKFSKLHNNANVIAFSANKPLYEILDMIDMYMKTQFSNEDRHLRRIEKINNYDN